MMATRCTKGMTFGQAFNAGSDIFFDLQGRGINMPDDSNLEGAFNESFAATGIPESLRGATFAGLLDQREHEFGWD